MEKEEKKRLLAESLEVWDRLSEEERRDVEVNTDAAAYRKGDRVHSAENDCIGVLLIRRGTLRTYMMSDEGREITLYRLGAGDVCVLSASCVLSLITFDVHIDAEEDTDALLINAACFSRLAKSNIYVECFAYRTATERFSDVMWAMQQILFMSMDKRLAVFLWDEQSRTGSDVIKLTHEQMARYIGSAREVVTRMLNYFADEGIVELSRGGVRILDRERLRALL